MVDLRNATDTVSARGERYAIVPEVAGWWVQSAQPNPLPVGWPWPVELSNRHLTDRVTSDLQAERGEVVVIVQKADPFYVEDRFVPLADDHYPVVGYVRAHFRKTHETKFFELYEYARASSPSSACYPGIENGITTRT